jgi:hypothetical protein
MKTLVIHPKDPTTDFLQDIYADLVTRDDWTLLRESIEDSELRNKIKSHDRIIMLGHGCHLGLYCPNKSKLIIEDSHADILSGKKLVGIWCYANMFFEFHGLLGIYSGMMISEMPEANLLGVDCSRLQIDVSNARYTRAVRKAIFDPFPIERFRQMYRSERNPVIMYNQDLFYHAYQTINVEATTKSI